jgi:hypothetical protein
MLRFGATALVFIGRQHMKHSMNKPIDESSFDEMVRHYCDGAN